MSRRSNPTLWLFGRRYRVTLRGEMALTLTATTLTIATVFGILYLLAA